MKEYLTPEIINMFITAIVLPLLAIISKFLVNFIRLKADEVQEKIENEKINKYIKIAEDAIATSVEAVSQSFVESLKKNGTFDKQAQEEAFELAKKKAVKIMGGAAKNTLGEVYGDVDAWLDNKIESYVHRGKI